MMPDEDPSEDVPTVSVARESTIVTISWEGERESVGFDPDACEALAFKLLSASRDAAVYGALQAAFSDVEEEDP